jgi:hypothetical protein
MEIEDLNYELLYKRVLRMKVDELFSEPYDGDMDEDDDGDES